MITNDDGHKSYYVRLFIGDEWVKDMQVSSGVWANFSEKLLPHEGAECCLVVEGELQIHFENRVYHLKAGDSISFLSHIPHEISNPFKKKAIAYWVNSVPWLFSTK